MKIYPILISAFSLVQGNLAAQSANSDVTVQTNARVAVALQLDKLSDMGFGVILANNGGEVTLNFDGSREVTSGDVSFISGISGDVKAAGFEAKGHPHSDVEILFPATMEVSNGTDNMTIILLSSVGTFANLFDDPPANRLSFDLGGILIIGQDQPAGNYEGTFTISVVYQ